MYMNSVLSKLRYFVISAWGFTSYPKLEVSILQKKTLRIINFVLFNAHTSLLFKICNILKFVDTVNVECCKFLNNCFNKDSFSIFTKRFKLTSTTHSYIRSVRNSLLFIPSYNSKFRFRKKSVIHPTTLTCNHLQDKLNMNFFVYHQKA